MSHNPHPQRNWSVNRSTFEPPCDKTNEVSVHPAKTQISLGIRPVWSESSLSAWRKPGPLVTYWAHSEDSDQTGRMPRLIWVFAGRIATLLVLSRGSSFVRYHNWASVWQNQQNNLCTQRSLRLAWASAQSDQSSLCAQWVAKDPMPLHMDSENWSDWADTQAGLILHWAHR